MIVDKNYKIAVIGCGRISGHHYRSIESIKGLEIVAVCDLIEEKAKDYAEEFAREYQSIGKIWNFWKDQV